MITHKFPCIQEVHIWSYLFFHRDLLLGYAIIIILCYSDTLITESERFIDSETVNNIYSGIGIGIGWQDNYSNEVQNSLDIIFQNAVYFSTINHQNISSQNTSSI